MANCCCNNTQFSGCGSIFGSNCGWRPVYGPTGPTGPTGPQGETGPTGPAGEVTPAAAVADLPVTATLADVVDAFNELLASLRDAGLLEDTPVVE